MNDLTTLPDNQWVLGGKNIDEDPLFSQYYLLDSARVYGGVRAFYDGLSEAYYIPAKAAARTAKIHTDKALRNPQWIDQNLASMRAVLAQIEAFLDRHPVESIPRLGRTSIIKMYATQQKLTERLYKVSRLSQALDRGNDYFTYRLTEQLREYSGDQVFTHFSILTAPSAISRFQQAELQENEIVHYFAALPAHIHRNARLYANAKERALVQGLAREYGHILYHGYGHRVVLSADDFWNRIQAKIDQRSDLSITKDILSKTTARQEEQQQLIRQLGIQKELQDLLTLYGKISLAKIDRRFTQVRNFVLLDALIGSLAQSFDIPELAFRFMTQSELTAIFHDDTQAAAIAEEALRRTTQSVWEYDQTGAIHIYTGQEDIKKLHRATIPVVRPRSHLTGTPVYVGDTIRATARLIYRAEDSFTAGDILVSEATDPDLVPHMRKASAVLTEQGGVTSHASIIARELQVPCMVGVQDLLLSVKDGDVLSINTKQGTVENLGQQQQNLVDLEHLTDATVQEFGGKAHGLFRLKSLGYGSYLPKTYFVRPGFSTDNSEDLSLLAQVISTLTPAKLAIRSSSVLEDAKTQSWAGQFPTFLYVEPELQYARHKLNELLHWKPTINYADNSEVPEGAMRAVIQEQVDASLSGVCFTKCPVTNDPSIVLIEFAQGCGDALVSGKVVPQRLVYSKTRAEFTETADTMPQDSYVSQAFLELVRVALNAEQNWEGPVDIEFAINSGNQLKLLQCRPVTT